MIPAHKLQSYYLPYLLICIPEQYFVLVVIFSLVLPKVYEDVYIHLEFYQQQANKPYRNDRVYFSHRFPVYLLTTQSVTELDNAQYDKRADCAVL